MGNWWEFRIDIFDFSSSGISITEAEAAAALTSQALVQFINSSGRIDSSHTVSELTPHFTLRRAKLFAVPQGAHWS